MSRFPANYIIYESGRHDWQLCRGNLVYFLDRRGLYRIEITNSLRPLSDAVDWEGLVFPGEVDFLHWCNQHDLKGVETFREQGEDGVAHVLQYPSGADVLISNGEIGRFAKNY